MSSHRSNLSAVLVPLMLALCIVSTACAREKHAMSAVQARPVAARDVFADPHVAELAQAVADGDATRTRALAPTVDLSTRGDKNVTLLQWAVFNRSLEGMKALLDAGANPRDTGMDGDTVIHTAAAADDAAYLSELLARGADPNAPNANNGAGPLRAALMGERERQFRALLAAGANPNQADRLGNTPLHVAGQINEPERALDLLEAGADPASRNAQGVTFQRYLFMTKPALLNADTRRRREAVEAWLTAHGIAIEGAR